MRDKINPILKKLKSEEKGKSIKNLKRKVSVSATVFFAVAFISFCALAHEKNIEQSTPAQEQNPDAKIVLYYSNQCPHCKNVEEYIAQNDVENKIEFAQKEVGDNRTNANEMIGKATLCNIQDKSLGIPFLWDGENGDKCLMGDKDIIEYFEIKANIQ